MPISFLCLAAAMKASVDWCIEKTAIVMIAVDGVGLMNSMLNV
jgi:hypothetical protein